MRRILDIRRALTDAGVDYVVVGGVAVVLQGHIRTTVDLDLALEMSPDNVAAVLGVLEAQGLRPRLPVPAEQFADPVIRQTWVEDRNLIAFTLHNPADALREVDLLATTPGPFAELSRAADRISVAGVAIPVASVDHLIAMKQSSARTQDLADIIALSALHGATVVEAMGAAMSEYAWRGTSDSPATLLARAESAPEARLAWLEDCLLLAQQTGALARDRASRQRAVDEWWSRTARSQGVANS